MLELLLAPLAILLIIFPVFMLINACWFERSLSTVVGLLAFSCHCAMLGVTFHAHLYWVIYTYLIVVNILWAASLLMRRQWNGYCVIRMRRKDIKKYQRIIDARPDHAAAHAAIADAYFECGELDKAIMAYERAIALAPDDCRLVRWRLRQVQQIRAQEEEAHRK